MEEIDVASTQAEQLAAAQLAPSGEQDHEAESLGQRIHQGVDLGEGGDRALGRSLDAATLDLAR